MKLVFDETIHGEQPIFVCDDCGAKMSSKAQSELHWTGCKGRFTMRFGRSQLRRVMQIAKSTGHEGSSSNDLSVTMLRQAGLEHLL